MNNIDTGASSQWAGDTERAGESATATTREYAQEAISSSGKKLRELRGEAGRAFDATGKYVADQPIQSVVLAAAGGAALTALILLSLRRG